MSLDVSAWTAPQRGALFVVTGASGTGKTTLVREALANLPGIAWSVSATTRAARKGEVHGEDYLFVSTEAFERKLQKGELLEWAKVYGNYYGTLRKPVEQALARGESILLEIDVQGARQVREAAPEAVLVFVLPPSVESLEARLRGRATDDDATIARRVAEAREQLQGVAEFDYIVVNDVLASAHHRFQAVLVAELQRRHRHPKLVETFAG
ncbi:MAG TPA: guanylate kinase [Deltaproteobacteria bacterium]|nr:guanylate kinase [Deltaproteobacteria bacterium]